MKKLLFSLLFVGLAGFCSAQTTWTMNFGTNTGTFVIAAGGEILSTTSQSPNLDVPQTSEPTQTVRLRKSNDANQGSFQLTNTGTTFGSGSRLMITAPSGTSSNKFSVYNIASTSKVMTVSFRMKFDAGTNGEQIFSIGNNDGGAFYSNGSGLTTQGFASIQWNLGAAKHAFSFFSNTTSNNSTTSISEALNPVIAGFTPNSEHKIQLYCNNTATGKSYSKNATTYNIGANKWQIWVDGVQLFSAAGVTDFGAGVLGSALDLNAFAYNSKSSSTSAITYLDDFSYTDFLPQTSLPVSLVAFTTQKQATDVMLKWSTASETNNAYFEVQRSTDGAQFNPIGKIDGAGNSQKLLNYYFTDRNPANGSNYYRLKQVDFDGKSTLTDPVAVNMGFGNLTMKISSGSNISSVNIGVAATHAGLAQVVIYDIGGNKVAEQTVSLNQGNNSFSLSMPNSNPGVFIAALKTSDQVLRQKFLR